MRHAALIDPKPGRPGVSLRFSADDGLELWSGVRCRRKLSPADTVTLVDFILDCLSPAELAISDVIDLDKAMKRAELAIVAPARLALLNVGRDLDGTPK